MLAEGVIRVIYGPIFTVLPHYFSGTKRAEELKEALRPYELKEGAISKFLTDKIPFFWMLPVQHNNRIHLEADLYQGTYRSGVFVCPYNLAPTVASVTGRGISPVCTSCKWNYLQRCRTAIRFPLYLKNTDFCLGLFLKDNKLVGLFDVPPDDWWLLRKRRKADKIIGKRYYYDLVPQFRPVEQLYDAFGIDEFIQQNEKFFRKRIAKLMEKIDKFQESLEDRDEEAED